MVGYNGWGWGGREEGESSVSPSVPPKISVDFTSSPASDTHGLCIGACLAPVKRSCILLVDNPLNPVCYSATNRPQISRPFDLRVGTASGRVWRSQ